MATCGFVNSLDYDKWSAAAKMALVMVMLIGGCIGSTAGCIKVGRLLVSCKYAYNELQVVASGIASCMGGVGPAYGIITFDWSHIGTAGKIIGFFAMYIGRLEMMPIFLLFIPELWRK